MTIGIITGLAPADLFEEGDKIIEEDEKTIKDGEEKIEEDEKTTDNKTLHEGVSTCNGVTV